MINLASFFTIQTPGNAPGTHTIGTDQLLPIQGDSAAPSEGGFSVFDILLSQIQNQITENGTEASEFQTAEKSTPLQSNNPTLDKNPKLDLIKILASNDTVAEEVGQLDEIVGLELIEEIEQTLALNQQIFDNIIEAGTGNDDHLQIDKETGEIIIPDIAKTLNISAISKSITPENIDDILAKVDISTLNLTPEQITLVQDIQNGVVPTEAQAKQVQEIAQQIIGGLVALVPPNKPELNIPPQAVKNGAKPAPLDKTVAPPANGAAEQALAKNAPEQSIAPLPFSEADGVDIDGNFEEVLRGVKGNGKAYAGNPIANGDVTPKAAPNAQAVANAAPQAAFNTLQAWPFIGDGALLSSSTFNDQIAEQLGLSLNGSNTSQGSLTALVSQAQSAAQSHPAVQTVAASISKSAINGDTDLSLRLDPPDLGRVDVKMTFSKDKTVKAVVTAEKPETFMMLQRDAQLLERALQDAGLDADGGLSFELAEHGFDFDQHNQRGGGHDDGNLGARGDGEAEGDMEIIESTMTWNVDPETGHTRYEIWA